MGYKFWEKIPGGPAKKYLYQKWPERALKNF
jgi:hypothetical protein